MLRFLLPLFIHEVPSDNFVMIYHEKSEINELVSTVY